jgi:hypothetical protein
MKKTTIRNPRAAVSAAASTRRGRTLRGLSANRGLANGSEADGLSLFEGHPEGWTPSRPVRCRRLCMYPALGGYDNSLANDLPAPVTPSEVRNRRPRAAGSFKN